MIAQTEEFVIAEGEKIIVGSVTVDAVEETENQIDAGEGAHAAVEIRRDGAGIGMIAETGEVVIAEEEKTIVVSLTVDAAEETGNQMGTGEGVHAAVENDIMIREGDHEQKRFGIDNDNHYSTESKSLSASIFRAREGHDAQFEQRTGNAEDSESARRNCASKCP
jgi:hypothetical protein